MSPQLAIVARADRMGLKPSVGRTVAPSCEGSGPAVAATGTKPDVD